MPKVLLSEKRTQVYFPEHLYRRIKKKAEEESRSSAAVIRDAVEQYLGKTEVDWENDPLFRLAGIAKSGVRDLSINHDHYLYGTRKMPVPVKR